MNLTYKKATIEVMPTYHNQSGMKAYIMNMFTHPDYRRQGIAYRTLDTLIKDAKRMGITDISLWNCRNNNFFAHKNPAREIPRGVYYLFSNYFLNVGRTSLYTT